MVTTAHVYTTDPSRSLHNTPRLITLTAALLVLQLVLMVVPVVVFGVDVGGIHLTISGFSWQIWLLALAVVFRSRSTS